MKKITSEEDYEKALDELDKYTERDEDIPTELVLRIQEYEKKHYPGLYYR